MHPVLVETHRSPVVASLDGGDRPPAPLHAARKRQFLKRTLGRLFLWGGMTGLVVAGWLFNCVLCQPLASRVVPEAGDWVSMSALQPDVQEVFRGDPRLSSLMIARDTVPQPGYNQLEVIALAENLFLTLSPTTLAELELNHSKPDLGSDPRAVSLEDLCGKRYGAERIIRELARLEAQGTITAARYALLKKKAEDRL